ncbi:MAG: hypothetical protein ABIG84_00775 [archaeon]
MGITIEKELREAGFRMLGTGKTKEKLILSILKSKDTRYLKAIPFLLYNYPIDIEKIYQKTRQKKLFSEILSITRKIFEQSNINKPLPKYSAKGNQDYEEFSHEFELQKAETSKSISMIDRQKIYAERDLEMWLSRLFTKKEKQIIKNILEEKPVTRTEYEYYSRKTRKKLNSIICLEDFAKTLYTKTPKCMKK